MQTFLPLPTYAESMRVLDPRRLGNQVYREGLTLIRGGWPNHPASRMWRGHWHHLALYIVAGLNELQVRGKVYPHHYEEVQQLLLHHPDTGPPPWLGDPDFHAAHRSNLLRKDPVWYGQFGWSESSDLPYLWPVNTVPVDLSKSPAPRRLSFGRKINE
jgi:hypothetical protein